MDPRISSALAALIATIIAVKAPNLGSDAATQLAGGIVTLLIFILGLFTRTPGTKTPPPDATFPAGQGGK
jgi:hypothetical protein